MFIIFLIFIRTPYRCLIFELKPECLAESLQLALNHAVEKKKDAD